MGGLVYYLRITKTIFTQRATEIKYREQQRFI